MEKARELRFQTHAITIRLREAHAMIICCNHWSRRAQRALIVERLISSCRLELVVHAGP